MTSVKKSGEICNDYLPNGREKRAICKSRKVLREGTPCEEGYFEHWDFKKAKEHLRAFKDWTSSDIEECLKNLELHPNDIYISEKEEKKQKSYAFEGIEQEGLQGFLTRFYSLRWNLKDTPHETAKGTVIYTNATPNSPYLILKACDPKKLSDAKIFGEGIGEALKKATKAMAAQKAKKMKLAPDAFSQQVEDYILKLSASIGQQGRGNPTNFKGQARESFFSDIEEKPSALAFKKGNSLQVVPIDSRQDADLNWGCRPTAYLIDGVDIGYATAANFEAVSSFFSPRFKTGKEGFQNFLHLVGAGLAGGARRDIRSAWLVGRGGDGKSALCTLVGAVLGAVFAKAKSEILIESGYNLNSGAKDLQDSKARVVCFEEFKIEANAKAFKWNDFKSMTDGSNPLEVRLGRGRGSDLVCPTWYTFFAGNGMILNVPNEHQKPILDRLAFFEMKTVEEDWAHRLKKEFAVSRFEESDVLKGGILYAINEGLQIWKDRGEIIALPETIFSEMPRFPWQVSDDYFRTPNFRAELRKCIGNKLDAWEFYELGDVIGNKKKKEMADWCISQGFVDRTKNNSKFVFRVLNFPAFDPNAERIELPSV